MSYYDDGYALGKAHARPNTNLDPRHSMAFVMREGGTEALDEFMRGFDAGYEAGEAENQFGTIDTAHLDHYTRKDTP